MGNCWRTEAGGKVTLWPLPGLPGRENMTTSEPPIPPELIRKGMAVDTEASGVDHSMHEIIELAMHKFLFHVETGEILHCFPDHFRMWQEPSEPLDPLITMITGYTDHDLKGKNIDWQTADTYMQDVDLIIAHNARFDRGFIDQKSKVSPNKYWACTDTQIDWRGHGFSSTKQELLLAWHGHYYEAHTALADVHALIYLLHFCGMKPPYFQKSYLKELIDTARKPITMVSAWGAPFDSKDMLRCRWYKWKPEMKVWRKVILTENSQDELEWLKAKVYTSPYGSVNQAEFKSMKLIDNFKST